MISVTFNRRTAYGETIISRQKSKFRPCPRDLKLSILEPKKRVALYARVSTDMQATGLEAQVRTLKEYCAHNKIEDFELYSDENFSGTKSSRPSLDRMMAAAKAGMTFSRSRWAQVRASPRIRPAERTSLKAMNGIAPHTFTNDRKPPRSGLMRGCG